MASLRVFCGRSSSLVAARCVGLHCAKLLSAASGSESTDVLTHTGQVFCIIVTNLLSTRVIRVCRLTDWLTQSSLALVVSSSLNHCHAISLTHYPSFVTFGRHRTHATLIAFVSWILSTVEIATPTFSLQGATWYFWSVTEELNC